MRSVIILLAVTSAARTGVRTLAAQPVRVDINGSAPLGAGSFIRASSQLEDLVNPSMQLDGRAMSTVPEPAMVTLLTTGVGGLGLVGLIRRRRGGGTSR